MKYFLVSLISLVGLILEWNLFSMWQADRDFAYGKNLDSVQHFADAYPFLTAAVSRNPSEPTFRDELSYNEAVLASSLSLASGSAQENVRELVDQAIRDSDIVVNASPAVMPFWKTRTRVFYQLGSLDPKYFAQALSAIQKAASLAPTDAKVHYNLGILLGKNGKTTAAIKAFEETIFMKPDYRDAYYALALYYNQAGDKQKARETMQQILSKIGPDETAQKWLEENK